MPKIRIKVICIRFKNFKEKIRLVKMYERKRYKIEILDNKFVYAEKIENINT